MRPSLGKTILIALLLTLFTGTVCANTQKIIFSKKHRISRIDGVGDYIFSKSEREYLKENGLSDIASARVFSGDDKKLKKVQKIDGHAIVEENVQLSALSQELAQEPLESLQWGIYNLGLSFPIFLDDIHAIDIPGVWGEDIGIYNVTKPISDKEIVVAVLDTGIDLTHPDLFDNISVTPSECRALASFQECLETSNQNVCKKKWGTVDSDGNGYPLDCYGWNLTGRVDRQTGILGDYNVTDKVGHGTHVSGIIAASKNGFGVRGVAPNVKILPVKVLMGAPTGPEMFLLNDNDEIPSPIEKDLPAIKTYGDIFARGLLYAIRSKVDVINMSLGWPDSVDSKLMRRLTELAIKKGIILVAAAGNDSTSATVLPCKYEGVICVASYNPDGSLSHFSNYGSSVEIAAPGFNILSTWPMVHRPNIYERKGFEFKNGTSMSSPFLAGVIAAMLKADVARQEIYPRLMLGARPSLVSTQPINLYRKYTLSGNVDMGRSMLQTARPYIMPSSLISKRGVQIPWNGKDLKLPIKFSLKNYWDKARKVEITAKIYSREAYLNNRDSGETYRLTKNSWSIKRWNFETLQNFSTTLKISDREIASELILELTIKSDNWPARVVKLQTDIFIPLEKADGLVVPVIQPANESIPLGASFRTIQNLDEKGSAKYLATYKKGNKNYARLLNRSSRGFSLSQEKDISGSDGSLLSLQSMDIDSDGDVDYVITYKLKPASMKDLPAMEFRIYDSAMNLKDTLTYDNTNSVLNENMQWMKVGDRRVPGWIGYSNDPGSSSATFDPWGRVSKDSDPRFRLLYFSENKQSSIEIPADYIPMKLLPATASQWQQGITPILLAKGIGYEYTFYLAEIKDKTVQSIAEIDFSNYHMIGGLNPSDLSFAQSDSAINAVFFSDDGPSGSGKISKMRYGSKVTKPILEQHYFYPINPLAKIHRIAAVMDIAGSEYAFVQSKYELQFHDLDKNEQVFTTLKRFSFMPGLFFDRLFFPVVATVANKKVPALLIPSGLATSASSEIVLPKYVDGKPISLYRPAKYRILPPASCTELNPVNNSLVFYCGDSIKTITL